MIKKVFLSLIIALVPTIGHASTSNFGTVSGYAVIDSYNIVVFFTDGIRTGMVPTCATEQGRWAVKSPAAISTILTAISTGKKISISGSGSCNVWGDSETAEVISLP